MNTRVDILTIDLEDWFHILDNDATSSVAAWNKLPQLVEPMTLRILDLLTNARANATFFVLGYVADKFPDLVREIRDRGHDIATHGYSHQLVYEQSQKAFELDLVASLEAIDKACGVAPICYRAPGFSITAGNEWAFKVLVKHGIEIDCSIFPASRAHGGMESFSESSPCRLVLDEGSQLKEFPISMVSVLGRSLIYGGGGYFRLLPWWLLNNCFRANRYNMTYFHPRDFEPNQPKIPGLRAVRTFKSTVGLRGSEEKFRRLLISYSFITVSEAVEKIDWSATPLICLEDASAPPGLVL